MILQNISIISQLVTNIKFETVSSSTDSQIIRFLNHPNDSLTFWGKVDDFGTNVRVYSTQISRALVLFRHGSLRIKTGCFGRLY